jgi:molecular chaperone GrpE
MAQKPIDTNDYDANADDPSPETNGNDPLDTTEQPNVQQLQEELKRAQDMYLRAMADFDNYRKRVERERVATARAGKRDLILRLLDIVDAFDRALAHMETAPEPVRAGVLAIHRQLMNLLQSQGVTPFDSVGVKFDPNIHEAVGAEDSDQYQSGIVIGEISRGYRWGDEILRPASVRVAK